jgi:hypothetical protein
MLTILSHLSRLELCLLFENAADLLSTCRSANKTSEESLAGHKTNSLFYKARF